MGASLKQKQLIYHGECQLKVERASVPDMHLPCHLPCHDCELLASRILLHSLNFACVPKTSSRGIKKLGTPQLIGKKMRSLDLIQPLRLLAVMAPLDRCNLLFETFPDHCIIPQR